MPSLMLILACVLWGLSFPLIKVLDIDQRARLPEATGVFLATWLQMARFGIAALMMAPVIARRGMTRSEFSQAAWLALWGGLGMALQAWGLGHTNASTSAFLTQAYCVFLPLVACLRTRCAPEGRIIAAIILVVAGGAILSGARPGDLRIGKGEIATLAASFLFTFQILTLENPKYAGNRGLTVTFAMCGLIAVLFFPICLTLAPDSSALLTAGASSTSFGILIVLALLCSVGAYGLMNSWQPRVSATEAGLIYTTEPVFAAAFALFLPSLLAGGLGCGYENEKLNANLLTGGSLILFANLLMQWKRAPHHAPMT
jgi:drug/metabolite transporter (DMT)-like permease